MARQTAAAHARPHPPAAPTGRTHRPSHCAQALLSGVYFVDDGLRASGAEGGGAEGGGAEGGGAEGGGAEGGGAEGGGSNATLEFVDPRYSLRLHRAQSAFEPPCSRLGSRARQLRAGYLHEHSPPVGVRPEPGAFALFPSWLMHRVRPHHRGGATRVSISFNLWVSDDEGGDAVARLLDGAFSHWN